LALGGYESKTASNGKTATLTAWAVTGRDAGSPSAENPLFAKKFKRLILSTVM